MLNAVWRFWTLVRWRLLVTLPGSGLMALVAWLLGYPSAAVGALAGWAFCCAWLGGMAYQEVLAQMKREGQADA